MAPFGISPSEALMPSELGSIIRKARKAKGIGVRELARLIERSGSFIVRLEKDDPPPSVAEDTLQAIAAELDLDPDQLITLAGKTPSDVRPEDAHEVALYRSVKELDSEQRKKLESYVERLRVGDDADEEE
jgi:transcriptional regulator with XRE-family HTH domain